MTITTVYSVPDGWKWLIGHGNEKVKYLVSPYGEVWAYMYNMHGNFIRISERKAHLHEVGYMRVPIWTGDVRKRIFVHRIVALAFHPNPENKLEVNHKDGNKLNNHVSNLEWCTSGENKQHAWDTGLRPRINKSTTKRIKTLSPCIKEMRGKGVSMTRITKELGVSESLLCRIMRNDNIPKAEAVHINPALIPTAFMLKQFGFTHQEVANHLNTTYARARYLFQQGEKIIHQNLNTMKMEQHRPK